MKLQAFCNISPAKAALSSVSPSLAVLSHFATQLTPWRDKIRDIGNMSLKVGLHNIFSVTSPFLGGKDNDGFGHYVTHILSPRWNGAKIMQVTNPFLPCFVTLFPLILFLCHKDAWMAIKSVRCACRFLYYTWINYFLYFRAFLGSITGGERLTKYWVPIYGKKWRLYIGTYYLLSNLQW